MIKTRFFRVARRVRSALCPILQGLSLAGCSVVNSIDVCDVRPAEYRVNERGDENEVPVHSSGASILANQRVLVPFVAVNDDETASEARFAMLARDGTRISLCEGASPERKVDSSDVWADSTTSSIARIGSAVGVLGWVEGKATTSRTAYVEFIDDAGCPLQPGPIKPGFGVTVSTGIAVAWSERRQAVLVTYHDGDTVYLSWLDSFSTTTPVMIARETFVGGQTVSAIAPDGRILVAWIGSESFATLSEGVLWARAVLLDADGVVQPSALAGGRAEPFTIDLPWKSTRRGDSLNVAVAARAGRFAVAADPSLSDVARPAVWVEEIDADDGSVVTPPFRVHVTGDAHGRPSLAYLRDGSLLVAWEAGLGQGTCARLFDSHAAPKFNTVSCNEDPFPVGARVPAGGIGVPSIAVDEDSIWIAHGAEPSYDPHGAGIVAWQMAYGKLWPGRR